jgi:hypothetical protein
MCEVAGKRGERGEGKGCIVAAMNDIPLTFLRLGIEISSWFGRIILCLSFRGNTVCGTNAFCFRCPCV